MPIPISQIPADQGISLKGSFYLDVNGQFTYDSNPLLIPDLIALNGQIHNVISTTPRTRWWEPTFGCNLLSYIFDHPTERSAWLIETEVDRALGVWLADRITTLRDASRVVPLPEKRAWVGQIVYEVKNLGITGQYDYLLQQGIARGLTGT